MNTYEKYKDSGVQWIGQIPSHWEPVRLKFLFQIVKDISGELGHDVLSVTQRGIKKKDLTTNEGQMSMDYSKYQFVRPGQFVMNHMDLLTGFVDISQYDGVTSPDYRVFEVSNDSVSPRYYLSIFQMCYHTRIFYGLGSGVSTLGRWRLPSDEFLNFPLPLPPLPEQHQIVSFLDEKTSLIDDLIKKKEQKIGLLKEYRTSLINRVITMGLNPDCPMKDSGVEWIGMIPSHWDVSKVSRHFYMERGRVISVEEIDRNIGEYPVYSSQTEYDGVLGRINTYDFDGEYVSWTTDGANAGTCFFRSGKFNTTNVCGLLSPKQEGLYSLRYVSYLLNRGTRMYVRLDINPKLMNNMMGEIPISLPTLTEQEQIVSFLDEKTVEIDDTIQSERKKIELLKEFRLSLISSVITGKIKVVN